MNSVFLSELSPRVDSTRLISIILQLRSIWLLSLDSVAVPSLYQVTTRKGGSPEQNKGSTQGGTLLWISGNDFVENDLSTVPSAATYDLRVYVNGAMIPQSQFYGPQPIRFESTLDNTPRISTIWPAIGEPQRLVTLTGDLKTQCYSRDVNECAREDASLISR